MLVATIGGCTGRTASGLGTKWIRLGGGKVGWLGQVGGSAGWLAGCILWYVFKG